MSTHDIVCPLCGKCKPPLIKTVPASEISRLWQKRLEMDVQACFENIQKIQIHQCCQTGFLFYWPFEIAGPDWLYEQLQEFGWYYMPEKWEYCQAVGDLTSHQCHKVLEVGCGGGDFLRRLIEKENMQAEGLELNKAAVKKARSNGLPVSGQMLDDFVDQSGHSFDAACAFQVLEHIANPRTFIQSMISAVKVGGMIIFAVPNHDSFIKYDTEMVLNAPPHHMGYWDLSVFQNLEKLFPLKLHRYAFEPLSACHAPGYIRIQVQRFVPIWPLPVIAGHTIGYALKALSGLRKKITGQCLYVCFRKTEMC